MDRTPTYRLHIETQGLDPAATIVWGGIHRQGRVEGGMRPR